MKKSLSIIASVVILLALSTVAAHAQNLLTNNPDFNTPPYNFNGATLGWTGTNVSGYYGSSNAFISGQEGVAYGYAGNGGTLATAAADRATVTTPGVESFTLTFQAQQEAGTQPTTFALDFFNAGGVSVGSVSLNLVPTTNLADGYSINGVAPVGSATAGARVVTVNGGQVRVDNFVLTSVGAAVVPEAGTLALLATGATASVGMVVRRKKSA